MNLSITPRFTYARFPLISFCFLAAFLLSAAASLQAQDAQLSLADLLIALRSKKVTIVERNTILTEAVKQRGVTFGLSPDIEKELTTTGATKMLVDAIREKNSVVKTVEQIPTEVATPVPTPAPPDFSFYQKRADSNLGKGEFSLALADYNKTVELKADNAVAFLNRGKTHYNLKSFDKSVADFDKAIELAPKDSTAYYNRGVSFEKMGNSQKAIGDYQKAADLDAANEPAKLGLKRLQDEVAKTLAKPPPAVVAPAPEKAPESINLGNLTSVNATNMVTPTYSMLAQRSNIEGRVVVEVELDTKGNVVSAKSASGHQMLRSSAEEAARRSKFKPALFGDKPIKASGLITYNFSLQAKK